MPLIIFETSSVVKRMVLHLLEQMMKKGWGIYEM
jgi:hypothetical protein